MSGELVTVLITVPSIDVGREIAKQLIHLRLAACVNILPRITSIYNWDEKVQEEEEVLLIIKTRSSLFEKDLIPIVKQLHPYQLPEIIALPISSGSEDYLKWVYTETA